MTAEPLVYALDLRDDPDGIAQYRAWHAAGAVPAEIVRSIRGAGIDALDIYLCGNRLMMLLHPGPGFDPAAKAAADAADPAVQAWEARMDAFQQRLPFAAPGAKWVAMERIFALAEQPQTF